MGVTFTTSVMQAQGKNATGISIPAEVIAALSGHKKPSVTVSLNGYTYRSTVAVMGNEFLLPLSAAHREASGLKAGDQVEVILNLDLEPRTVEIPDDLRAALSSQEGAIEAFEALAFSKRKEFVRQVDDAKTQDTRHRRILGIVTKLSVT
ncbi:MULTISPECIES: YdeI/OmpD-associated family protein [unclassified Paenibacillus]|uniref:YdeI/OmpD-associated family protein n=1 Tax=unclassified Paenibacillus TaxID=185978 RepID=UPI002782D278|nr:MULTISPECIES: YdeI/OmpD-associated family protein [unclassified Paenibacillus]MDQ0903346.1 antitoxin component of MazEF toxin-antitoxin module [Paenibacillus sp. V4I7]MDQ0918177.1 antitoxin component of MazEF toxin-antitoxin module [Paenibacillus sp. V4I5]